MTSPVLAPQPDPYASDRDRSDAEEAAVAALAVFLSSALAVPTVTLPTALVARLAALGMAVRAIRAAGRLVLEPALPGRGRWGSPKLAELPAPAGTVTTARRFGKPTMVRRMASAEPDYRARFLLAAAHRLTTAILNNEFTAGLARERRYLAAHRRAGKRRARIAREYDRTAKGQTYLKWQTRMDSAVTADCAARHGSIWSVDNPPWPIPGAAHVLCRCKAVPA